MERECLAFGIVWNSVTVEIELLKFAPSGGVGRENSGSESVWYRSLEDQA